MTTLDPLARVRRAAARRAAAQQEFEAAIVAARTAYSLRKIATAAGLSFARVRQIEQQTSGGQKGQPHGNKST